VVDGDTIRIRDLVIRVSGIDAPELNQPYGEKAKWALHRLCKGHDIRAELDATDVHGRTVARCFLPDGRDLAAEMVRAGHAVDWPRYSGGRYRHLEVPGVRKRLWRCDARQKGRFPPG
jgi:endonuclease YncB( thermonuclease family)